MQYKLKAYRFSSISKIISFQKKINPVWYKTELKIPTNYLFLRTIKAPKFKQKYKYLLFIRNGLSSNLKDMVGAEYRSYHQAKGRHHEGINNGNKEVW